MPVYHGPVGNRVESSCSACRKRSLKYETLTCDHTFCDACVNHQISRLSSVRDFETVSIVCPYCRDFFVSKLEFLKTGTKKTQTQKKQILEFVPSKRDPGLSAEIAKRCQPCAEMREYTPSSFWCHNCTEYMCSTCANYHTKMKMAAGHVVKTLRDKEKYEDVRTKVYDPPKPARTPPRQRRLDPNRHKCEPCGQSKRVVEAGFACQNCNEKMCEACAKSHISMKMSKSHKITMLTEAETRKSGAYPGATSDATCNRHFGETLSLYCKRCKTSTCPICVISLHSNCGPASKISSKSTYDKSYGTVRDRKPTDEYLRSSTDFSKVSFQPRDDYSRSRSDLNKPSILKQSKDDGFSSMTWGFKDSKKDSKNDSDYNKRDSYDYKKDSKDSKKDFSKIPKNKMENRKSRINYGSDTPGDWVISLALLGTGDLLLTELHQPTLKLVDSTGALISACTLRGDPWAVAVYNDSLAAVTFSDRKQVQLVKISHLGRLEAGKVIQTSHKNLGVCFAKDLIVTSCWEGCIHVYNVKGTELCAVNKDNYGDKLFASPEYITANKLGTTIYVTDYRRDTVTALKILPNRIDNKPEWVFQHKDLRGPKGVTVDRYGVVYVSGMSSRNIFRLSPGGEMVQVYRRREDTEYYEAIAVSSMSDKLLVSAFEDNTIVVLRLTA